MQLGEFNDLTDADAETLLQQCCNASRWVQMMSDARPYTSIDQLLNEATARWNRMESPDWLEAFDGHPKIGDPGSLKKKYQATHGLASSEQSAVQSASDETLDALAAANASYADKFGFIFIICATGKSAQEMLQSISKRLGNQRQQELEIAAAEQLKITHIRLSNLIHP